MTIKQRIQLTILKIKLYYKVKKFIFKNRKNPLSFLLIIPCFASLALYAAQEAKRISGRLAMPKNKSLPGDIVIPNGEESNRFQLKDVEGLIKPLNGNKIKINIIR